MIPTSYETWRHCIEVHCRIPLDGAFIAQRLRELDDRRLHSTEQLLRRYGERHVAQLRAWFTRAGEELDGR